MKWQGMLYNGLIHLFLPLIAFLSWRKCKKAAAEKQQLSQCFAQKFGKLTDNFQQNSILIHAVSLGETRSILPLIARLQKDYPDTPITLTNGSVRGAKQLITQLPEGIQYSFLPLDYPFAIQRFLKQLQPKKVLIVETEIWPNLISECQKQNIPLHFINARLKASSMQKYQQFGGDWLRETLNKAQHIHCQFASDKAHFIELRVAEDKLSVMGNLKFDLNIPTGLSQSAARWKQNLPHDFVWVAASTHEHEEALILQSHQQLLKTIPNALLIVVPRQADRFDEVSSLLKTHNISFQKRSEFVKDKDLENQSINEDTQVILGDSVGEMLFWMAASDAAFIGGSLVPFGGHNILEPAAFQKPVLTGPHFQNLQALFEVFIKDDSLTIVKNESALGDFLIRLAKDHDLQHQLGEKAHQTFIKQSGSLKRLMTKLSEFH